MEILIFIYNIILIVLYTVAVTFSVLNYRQKKRQLSAVTAVLFLFYILDNVIIYMTEFLDGFSAHYDFQFMTVPAFKTLILLVTAFCLASIQNLVLSGRQKNRDIFALILLGLGLLFIPMAGNGPLKVWLYYLPAQLFTLYLGTSGLLYLKRSPDRPDRETAPYKRLLWITVIFSILIIIEDTIVIFSFDIYSDIMVKINNRSVSEDIMSVIYSVYAIGYLTRQLQSPRPDTDAQKQDGSAAPASGIEPPTAAPAPASADDAPASFAAGDLNTAFLHFASQYQLTSREQDILRILLMDKNNQEISDALFISVGTVKTHVHNIFQKVNVTKRSQLLKLYYEYQNDMPWR